MSRSHNCIILFGGGLSALSFLYFAKEFGVKAKIEWNRPKRYPKYYPSTGFILKRTLKFLLKNFPKQAVKVEPIEKIEIYANNKLYNTVRKRVFGYILHLEHFLEFLARQTKEYAQEEYQSSEKSCESPLKVIATGISKDGKEFFAKEVIQKGEFHKRIVRFGIERGLSYGWWISPYFGDVYKVGYITTPEERDKAEKIIKPWIEPNKVVHTSKKIIKIPETAQMFKGNQAYLGEAGGFIGSLFFNGIFYAIKSAQILAKKLAFMSYRLELSKLLWEIYLQNFGANIFFKLPYKLRVLVFKLGLSLL